MNDSQPHEQNSPAPKKRSVGVYQKPSVLARFAQPKILAVIAAAAALSALSFYFLT